MLRRLKVALALGGAWCLVAHVATAQARLEFSSSVAVSQAGGLSALELRPDGASGIVASDRGGVFSIDLVRTNGILSAAKLSPWSVKSHIEGDVEGIATTDFETVYFSLEGPARVLEIGPTGKTKTFPKHRDFARMGSNRSLEGLAIHSSGALYTAPENLGSLKADSSFYVFADGRWSKKHTLSRTRGFKPVGADFGPDNRLYVLERALTPFGFRTQVQRYDFSQRNAPPELLLSTWALQHDNLEGISLWRDSEGFIRATMISDNNFRWLQRNQIVEYRLVGE